MSQEVIYIWGPPGCGKTYNAARFLLTYGAEAYYDQKVPHSGRGYRRVIVFGHRPDRAPPGARIQTFEEAMAYTASSERMHASYFGGSREVVNHPAYEAIKVIEAWRLGFCLGNTIKYIARAGKKPETPELVDLRKARWYLDREIARLEREKKP